MRTNNVGPAVAETLGAIADDLVAFALVNRIGQSVSAKWSVFLYGACSLRTVRRYTAGKDKAANIAAGAVDDADRFHHARCAGNVDLPHALHIENAGALRVKNKCEMNDGLGPGVAQQFDELAAAGLATQIHFLELQRRGSFGWAHIDAHHTKLRE